MPSYGEKPVPQTPGSSPSNSPQRSGGELPAVGLGKGKARETDDDKEKDMNKGEVEKEKDNVSAVSTEEEEGGEGKKANGHADEQGGAAEERREEDGEEDMELDEEMPGSATPSGSLPQSSTGGGNRVKVYELQGGGWRDMGTGFVRTGYDQANDKAEIAVAREEDGHEIMRRPIHKEDIYTMTHGHGSSREEEQRAANGSQEQPTLITWTEPDGQDYALSFQDPEGCQDVWDFILDVQAHIVNNSRDDAESSLSGFSPPTAAPSSPFSTSSVPSSPDRLPLPVSDVQIMISNLIQRQELPVPQMGNINEIEQAFKLVSRNQGSKQKLCEAIVLRDFWKQCIEIHGQAEDLESIEDLHALCKLAQTLLLLNDPAMYDYIAKDDVFLGVLGMLEYDPDFPTVKGGYRDFMRTVSKFREVIDLKDDVITRKVHNVYRLQFLADVVLARVLDDPVFTVLKSCLLFQQVDIIQYFNQEESLLREILSHFDDDAEAATKSPETADPKAQEKRADLILLLHQMCMMAKSVQVPLRVSLYRKLVDKGLVNALSWGLMYENPQVRSATGEILSVVVDHDSAAVRNFILNQVGAPPTGMTSAPSPVGTPRSSRKPTLLDTMQQILLTPEVDVALKSQMADATKTLLEVLGTDGPVPPDALQRAREDSTIERFLTWFYQGDPVKDFFMPLLRLPEFQLAKKDPPTLPIPPKLNKAQVPHILYLTELLATFAVQHTHRSSFFIMSSVISTRIAMLLLVKEKHIRIAALRFFRSLLRMGNQFVFRHMLGKDLFFPLIELAGRESANDNLISACYQEYFDYLKKENVRTVINALMLSYSDRIREIARDKTPMGRIFQGVVLRWEQNNDSAAQQSQPIRPAAGQPIMRWAQGQSIETEEEDYFNGSDDEEEIGPQPANGPKSQKRKAPPKGGASGPSPPSPPRATSLVDYEDNEDEDMDKDSGEGSSSSQLEPPPQELPSAAAQGTDSLTLRHILRPRPLYTNGVKPSKGPLSPALPIPSISRRRSSPALNSGSQSPRNGMRTPSPPPSKLGRKSPPPSPRASPSDTTPSPPRPGEKRKRDEEDDDDLLITLGRTSKRRSLGPEPTPETGMTLPKTIPIPGAAKEDGKKMKLKLGKSAISVVGPTTTPPTPPPAAAAAGTETKDNG